MFAHRKKNSLREYLLCVPTAPCDVLRVMQCIVDRQTYRLKLKGVQLLGEASLQREE